MATVHRRPYILAMTDIPRGKYIGERVGGPPKDDAEHFIRCPKYATAGSICAIWARCSSTKARCRIRAKISCCSEAMLMVPTQPRPTFQARCLELMRLANLPALDRMCSEVCDLAISCKKGMARESAVLASRLTTTSCSRGRPLGPIAMRSNISIANKR